MKTLSIRRCYSNRLQRGSGSVSESGSKSKKETEVQWESDKLMISFTPQ